MTTVAYKDGMIAADTMITENFAVCGQMTKIAKTPDGRLVGASGSAIWAAALVAWARKGKGNPPDCPEESSGILIGKDGSITCLDHGGNVRLVADHIAIGSGTRYAMGVMAYGGTAADAVTVASEIDLFTGGRIDVLTQ